MCRITIHRVTGGQSPAVRPVVGIVFGVIDAVLIITHGMIAHHVPVVGVLVFQPFGIQADPAVVCPEQRATGLFGSVVLEFERIAVGGCIALDATAACPSLVIACSGYSMGR